MTAITKFLFKEKDLCKRQQSHTTSTLNWQQHKLMMQTKRFYGLQIGLIKRLQ
jgi:hypothetical protein